MKMMQILFMVSAVALIAIPVQAVTAKKPTTKKIKVKKPAHCKTVNKKGKCTACKPGFTLAAGKCKSSVVAQTPANNIINQGDLNAPLKDQQKGGIDNNGGSMDNKTSGNAGGSADAGGALDTSKVSGNTGGLGLGDGNPQPQGINNQQPQGAPMNANNKTPLQLAQEEVQTFITKDTSGNISWLVEDGIKKADVSEISPVNNVLPLRYKGGLASQYLGEINALYNLAVELEKDSVATLGADNDVTKARVQITKKFQEIKDRAVFCQTPENRSAQQCLICPVGQIQDPTNGAQCVCAEGGQEMVNGTCVAKCTAPQTRDANGLCKLTAEKALELVQPFVTGNNNSKAKYLLDAIQMDEDSAGVSWLNYHINDYYKDQKVSSDQKPAIDALYDYAVALGKQEISDILGALKARP